MGLKEKRGIDDTQSSGTLIGHGRFWHGEDYGWVVGTGKGGNKRKGPVCSNSI